MNPTNEPLIIIDHRELPSGVPDLLKEAGATVEIKSLRKGDYLVAKHFLVERKTKNDFVVSIIGGRLFTQCLKIAQSQYHPLLIIEGNPYQTAHNIKRSAIKGALLAVCTAWHIPIIFTHDREDTATTLMHSSQLV
ncbi:MULTISPECIES: ERCC4 domain-containing protein [unclassified Carboxylicivirga]|uniref:ERCC4 domain-containing protein n=1 Tax=Carboxylicivirga TaxID=1628153 RepID=UPI003D34430D